MGTSASNGGPKKNSSLLPSWAQGLPNDNNSESNQENNNNEEGTPQSNNPQQDNDSQQPVNNNTSEITGNWGAAKGALTRYSRRTSGSSLKKAAQSYVKTLGGTSKAAKSASKGISTGGVYVNFIGSISRNGYAETLTQYGLADCIGKPSEEVLARIADKIAPIGSTNDEAIARSAILASLDSLYERLLSEGKDVDALGSLDEQSLKASVEEYVSTYIFQKWVYEVGIAIEKNNITERAAVALEKEIKVFVRGEVKSALRDKDIIKFNLVAGQELKMVKDIFELAYTTIPQ